MYRVAVIFIAYISLSFTTGNDTTEIAYSGIAQDINSGDFLYKELNKTVYENGKQTITQTDFADADDKIFASRILDFSKSETKPFYEFSDKRHGHYERVEYTGSSFKIKYRDSFDESYETAEISVPEPAIVDGGFTFFIKNNWSKLIEGEQLVCNFISVSRQDYFQFEVSVAENQFGIDEHNVLLQMQPHNFFLKALVDPILVTYNKKNREIVSYKGISNIRDEEGGVFDAYLQYENR